MQRIRSQYYSGLIALVVLFALTSCFRASETDSEELKEVDPKVEKLKIPAGFHAEHLYSPSENDHGSWVSMTFDPQGRIIASDQYGSLYRMEIPPLGEDTLKAKVEKLEVNMGHAQGLLWAFNSLYVMVNNHPKNENFERQSGLYRLQDSNNNGQFDKVTMLKALKGNGEHGPHSVVLAPDGNSLYVIIGNHTDVPEMDSYRVPPVWEEDNLFPLIKDPGGHATNRMAPGGWVAKVDSLGQHWEMFSVGYRNPFDLAFNEAGDMFTFDSDMEWDLGTPWYRPTRICHITSGSEYGWRTGSGKWSPAFPDNLPPVINMGQGSPTGVIHGKTSKFPDKYQKALYAFDWSFGIIYAVHLQPNGASYTAEAEEFISGMPLPLTDGIIGPDGALYFMTGGRKLESDVYRVYYEGSDKVRLSANNTVSVPEENKLRRELEKFHGQKDQAAIDFAWPHLKHSDRFVRFAARIALEHQPVNQWQEKLFKETDPEIKIEGMIALARHGQNTAKDRMINTLSAVSFDQLSESRQVDLLRAYELIFSRMDKPNAASRDKILSQIDNYYPANTDLLNRQLSKILIYLEAPDVVARTITLLEKAEGKREQDDRYNQASDLILRNPQYGLDIAEMLKKMPPSQQTYYAIMLSSIKSGWTPELRDQYFSWFNTAFNYSGGRSYKGFIERARKDALAHVPKDKFEHYDKISGAAPAATSVNMANVSRPKGPWREWDLDEAIAAVEGDLKNRDFEQGKDMFVATGCLTCHNMQGEGNNLGPDLTQLGTRFSTKDMVEHIMRPNKEVSDQYASTIFTLKDGSSVVGRIARQNDQSYFIAQNPFSPDEVREIPKSDVTDTKVSNVSIMPPGLLNPLNEEELKDLIAYLMAGGNKEHPVYTEESQ